jgi:hypothetical protein
MNYYCNVNGVPLTAFARHAEQLTEHLIAASEAEAKRLGRPIEYLASPKLRKEDHARLDAKACGANSLKSSRSAKNQNDCRTETQRIQ